MKLVNPSACEIPGEDALLHAATNRCVQSIDLDDRLPVSSFFVSRVVWAEVRHETFPAKTAGSRNFPPSFHSHQTTPVTACSL